VAERAASEGLSVRDVRKIVVDEVANDTERRTRRHKPLILKTIDRSLKLFTLESGRRTFTKAHVDELNEDEVKEAAQGAEDLIESLQKLLEKLNSNS